LHHGTMHIRSQLGRGTMVMLRLPVDRASVQKLEMADAAA
jgi:signal transduction histidine kinase